MRKLILLPLLFFLTMSSTNAMDYENIKWMATQQIEGNEYVVFASNLPCSNNPSIYSFLKGINADYKKAKYAELAALVKDESVGDSSLDTVDKGCWYYSKISGKYHFVGDGNVKWAGGFKSMLAFKKTELLDPKNVDF